MARRTKYKKARTMRAFLLRNEPDSVILPTNKKGIVQND